MSNHEYWAKRALNRAKEAYRNDADLTSKIFDEYQIAAKMIRRNISDFYIRYAKKYGLTYEDAAIKLNKREFQEWKSSLREYVERIKQAADEKTKVLLTAELDALSYNSSITRLEALNSQIDMILNELFDRGVREMKEQFGDAFVENYYKKAYDIQSRYGMSSEIAKIDAKMIEDVISYPWSGATFSERVWKNKKTLAFNLRETLTQGLIQGKSVSAMSSVIAKSLGQSYKNAERLIRTESTRIHAESDLYAYTELGVKQYEFMATLEARTCEICGSLDGKRFETSKTKVGINYPPIHPNCRCTTVEYDPDDEADWITSGYEMSNTKTYEEWYREQTERNGQGFVETERKKAYNKSADIKQFALYTERLGSDAPSNFGEFQDLKYRPEHGDSWAETKGFYLYKGKVPEATKADFNAYQRIKATGIHGTVRVPPVKIDSSSLTIDAAHIAKKHSVTLEEAQSFIDNAIFSLRRKHHSGKLFINYYSEEGAAYVLPDQSLVRTAFKSGEYDKKIKGALEVAKNEGN